MLISININISDQVS